MDLACQRQVSAAVQVIQGPNGSCGDSMLSASERNGTG